VADAFSAKKNDSSGLALLGYPGCGASWEGFALEQILQQSSIPEVYFWSTYSGAELDLLFLHGGRWMGVEFKFSGTPQVTRSMRVAIHDLDLARLWIVAPVEQRYEISSEIEVCPISAWPEAMSGV